MPQQATISDTNRDLINVYRTMAKNPSLLRDHLIEHQENHSLEHYYNVRNHVPDDPIASAARFLYLNRTCFNGMYRVNQYGLFNVPMGTRLHFIDDVAMFEDYAQVLHNARFCKNHP